MRSQMVPEVLIVDDDENIRKLVETILDWEGYRSETATNGREALDHLVRCGPRVVLLGLIMPVMDGTEAMMALKRLPHVRRQHQIVLMSARHELAKYAIEIGADGAVQKPFTPEQLISAVDKAMVRLRNGEGPRVVH